MCPGSCQCDGFTSVEESDQSFPPRLQALTIDESCADNMTEEKVYYDAEGKPLDARYNILQEHLSVQDLQTLKVEELNPDAVEVISRQATINIGTIGHVAHGKSTVVKSISGVQTVRFKHELERNITIAFYANAKIYRNIRGWEPPSPGPEIIAVLVAIRQTWTDDRGTWQLERHVSFVDCPGHDILMATMLNGAAVMTPLCCWRLGTKLARSRKRPSTWQR